MTASEDVLTELACDYITCIAPETRGGFGLHSAASSLFRWQAETGNKIRGFGMSGFSGWQCGSVAIGTRKDDVMVRLSSDSAASSWRTVAQHAANITRFDVQATIKLPDGPTQRISRDRRAARRDSQAKHDVPIVRWIQDHKGGFTLYLGARSSLVFGRIYDKWQRDQLDHYVNCIRYEVQFQRELAWNVATDLLATSSERPRIASRVLQFFHGRGISLELPYQDAATYCCSRPRSDVDKNLEWLRTAVRPCVTRLIAAGRGDDVFRALGLIVDEVEPLDQSGPDGKVH